MTATSKCKGLHVRGLSHPDSDVSNGDLNGARTPIKWRFAQQSDVLPIE